MLYWPGKVIEMLGMFRKFRLLWFLCFIAESHLENALFTYLLVILSVLIVVLVVLILLLVLAVLALVFLVLLVLFVLLLLFLLTASPKWSSCFCIRILNDNGTEDATVTIEADQSNSSNVAQMTCKAIGLYVETMLYRDDQNKCTITWHSNEWHAKLM